MTKIYICYTALLIFFRFSSEAQYVYQVKDVSPKTLTSSPSKGFVSGPYVYFTADDIDHGRELWRTDGTPGGTVMVKDIYNGNNTAFWPNYGLSESFFIDVNGQAFFIARDTSGHQLWTTDGTEAGTIKLTNVSGSDFDYPMININGILFFMIDNDLWKTDGTVSGTSLVKNGSVTAAYLAPPYFAKLNNLLIFVYHNSGGNELWKSDGTTAGTVGIKDINPGGADGMADPNGFDPYFTEMNGNIYFLAKTASNGVEIWKTDGTNAGTSLVKDINPGSSDAFRFDWGNYSQPLKLINGNLYFSADDGVNGVEPWISDGTETGTIPLANIDSIGSSYPAEFTLSDSSVVFRARNSAIGYELWKTDGTSLGTNLLIDIIPDSSVSSDPRNFAHINGKVYFMCLGQGGLSQIWKTDGTTAGTIFLLNETPNVGHPITEMEVVNNDLYVAFTGSINEGPLWKIDGLTNNVQFVKEINAGEGGNIGQMTACNNKLIFSGLDSIAGQELWVSDGTTAGTQILKDINTLGGSYVGDLTDVNGTLFFTATDEVNGFGLWKSNGSTVGTQHIGQRGSDLLGYKGYLYYDLYVPYMGLPGVFGATASKTDGSGIVTELFLDSLSTSAQKKKIDGYLYLYNSSGLWKLDGTTTGIVNLINYDTRNVIKNGSSLYASNQYNITKVDLSTNIASPAIFAGEYRTAEVLNDTMFFSLPLTGGFGNEGLWRTDGTQTGTVVIDANADVYSMLAVGNKLFLLAVKNGTAGLFYMSSATDTLHLLQSTWFAEGLINVNGIVYFTAIDANMVPGLWKSDGTPAGTIMVKQLSGIDNSSFKSKDGILYFIADDGINGTELWKSNGTFSGTVMLSDINPAGNSNPGSLTVCGDYIYFVADNGITGPELWAYGISTTPNCFASYETSYDTLSNSFTLMVDSITATQAVSYLWGFGDGTTSTLSNPSHVYANDAIYNLCLKAYTTGGDSCSFCREIGKDSLGNIIRTGGFEVNVQNPGAITNIKSDQKENDKIVVFPNPSEGRTNLILHQFSNKATIKVFNIAGSKVIEMKNCTGNKFNIDLTNQQSGIYFIEVTDMNSIYRTKFVKE